MELWGTVHGDPEGHDRLTKALWARRPDAVTVEISPMSVLFRVRQGPRLLDRLRKNAQALLREFPDEKKLIESGDVLEDPRLESIARKCSMPYEFDAASQYGRQARIPVTPVDLSEEAFEHLVLLAGDLVSEDNLRMVLAGEPEPDRGSAARHYAIAREIVEGRRAPDWTVDPKQRDAMLRRDRHMAREIRRVLEEMENGVLVHVGGYEHLAPVPGSLRTLLAAFDPDVMLLGETA